VTTDNTGGKETSVALGPGSCGEEGYGGLLASQKSRKGPCSVPLQGRNIGRLRLAATN